MNPEFWRERWQAGQIGFHEGKPNEDLVAFWSTLNLPAGARVLVPLCGKTHDLAWLHAQGHQVVGVELSELACAAFFEEHGRTPERTTSGPYTVWRTPGLEIWQGDVLELPDDGGFDAIWDRAASVALPPDLRRRYAATLARVAKPGAQMLLSVFNYPQAERDGPPFSLPPEEIEALYATHFQITRIPAEHDMTAEIARFGVAWATIDVYRLTR